MIMFMQAIACVESIEELRKEFDYDYNTGTCLCGLCIRSDCLKLFLKYPSLKVYIAKGVGLSLLPRKVRFTKDWEFQ